MFNFVNNLDRYYNKNLCKIIAVGSFSLFHNLALSQQSVNIRDHFVEYQNFLRHPATKIFADDGLEWSSYEMELQQGVKNSDGSCTMRASQNYPSTGIEKGTFTVVEQAKNSVTCQSLVKKGNAKLPSQSALKIYNNQLVNVADFMT